MKNWCAMKKSIIFVLAGVLAASCTVYKDGGNYDNNLQNLCISLVSCCADQPVLSMVEALSSDAKVFDAKWEKTATYSNSVLPDNLVFVIKKAEADSTWTVEGTAGKGNSGTSGHCLAFKATIKLLKMTNASNEFPELNCNVEKIEYDESNGYLASLDKAFTLNYYWLKSGSPSYVSFNLTKKGECQFNTFHSGSTPADWCKLHFNGNYLSSCNAEIGRN